jgi:hypothetical protein
MNPEVIPTMRKFNRAPVVCDNCGANIYNWMASAGGENGDPKNDVRANWAEPPKINEACPRCANSVDTTNAYPYIAGFPPNLESLQEAYNGFRPKWEHNRRSFEREAAAHIQANGLDACEASLNTDDGFDWYRQRMFYRSAAAFYRSLQLFLGSLTLDRHCYKTWTEVTAYYSRFYFIQAFLNLLLSTHQSVDERAFIFFDGKRINCIASKKLPKAFRTGPHEIWWSLMEAMKSPNYPCDNLGFILSRLVYNPEQRNTVNYGFEYHYGGFIELDWFDSGAKQMLSQFAPQLRPDEDITDINRFFGDQDLASCDEADFYSDAAQITWCSLMGYLQVLKALRFEQEFVTTEKILTLCDLHIGSEYPHLIQGIAKSVHGCLQDGFDLEQFLRHYQSSDGPEPFTCTWLHRGEIFPKSRMSGS